MNRITKPLSLFVFALFLHHFATAQIVKTKQDSIFFSTLTPAQFSGGMNAWVQFLQNNINGKLGQKYVNIPKNETSASQVAKVSFLVDTMAL